MDLLASLSICAQSQWGLGCHIQGFIPAPDVRRAGRAFWQLVRFWVELGSSGVSRCVVQEFVPGFPKENVLVGWIIKASGRRVLEGKQKKKLLSVAAGTTILFLFRSGSSSGFSKRPGSEIEITGTRAQQLRPVEGRKREHWTQSECGATPSLGIPEVSPH